MTLIGYMYQEKKEEDLPALKIAYMHQYKDSKIRLKKSKERLITVTRNNTNDTRIKRTITKKQKVEGKQLYGYFKQQTDKILYEKTLPWLWKGNLKRETKSILIAAQNNTIQTNYIKVKMDKMQQNSKYRS